MATNVVILEMHLQFLPYLLVSSPQ